MTPDQQLIRRANDIAEGLPVLQRGQALGYVNYLAEQLTREVENGLEYFARDTRFSLEEFIEQNSPFPCEVAA